MPRVKSQQKRADVTRSLSHPFKSLVGQLDRTFGRVENRLSSIRSRPASPQDSPTGTEVSEIQFTRRIRWSRLIDSGEADPSRSKRSSTIGRYLHPFDQALQNCQRTFVVVQKLKQLLTDLLELECRPLSSGCQTNDNGSRSTVVSDILECELMQDLDRGNIFTGLQRIRQMRRLAMWKCDEIKDELRSVQITSLCDKNQKIEGEKLFTKRWGRTPNQGFRNIDMTYPAPVHFAQLDIEQFLQGTITEDSVECVMDYWPTLEREFRQKQIAYRSESGKKADYGLDNEVIVDMIDNYHGSSAVRAKTARRCTSNIETVRAALNDLLEEASEEYSHRKSCPRQPFVPGHRRLHSSHLYAVSATLQWIVCHLSTAEDGAKRLAIPKLSKGGELVQKPCSLRMRRLIHDWASLSENGFGGLLTLSLKEVVERLVRKPLSEDEVTAQDPILKNIPYYLRPK
ncbi:hypothetical protein MMC34_008064 [Xylographa carneopallida]|nr:hypothetical protein [Xylographa carneopallida]